MGKRSKRTAYGERFETAPDTPGPPVRLFDSEGSLSLRRPDGWSIPGRCEPIPVALHKNRFDGFAEMRP